MSQQITSPTKIDRLMAALSAAEQMAANSPAIPTAISVQDNLDGSFTVEVFFHHRPEDVAAFAAAFGSVASARPHYGDDTKTYTSADGSVDGIAFRAWSLDAVVVAEQGPVAA